MAASPITVSKSPGSGESVGEEEVKSAACNPHTPTRLEPDNVDEASIIAKCQRDPSDDAAYGVLFERYAARVYGHLVALFGRNPDVEDVLQNVFVQAFRNISKYDGRASFAAWIRGITVNVAMTSMRSWRRRRAAMDAFSSASETTAPSAYPSPEVTVEVNEQARRLDYHLQLITPDKRVAFLLYYVEQLGLAEIAKSLGISQDLAWARIRRARIELLEKIARERSTPRLPGRAR